MGMFQDIKNRFLIRTPDERKYFDQQLERERGKAAEVGKEVRRGELREMARMQALPPAERVKLKLQGIREGVGAMGAGAQRGLQGYARFDAKAKKIHEKLGGDRSVIGDAMRADARGDVSRALDRREGDIRERTRSSKSGGGKKVTITFD